MAVAFRAAAQNAVASTSLTVNVPSGTLDGDIMVAVILVANSASLPSTPSGWTALDNGQSGPTVQTYWRTAASEPANYTWTSAVSAMAGVVASYSGADPTTPINAHGALNRDVSATTSSATTITTSVDNCMVVYVTGLGTGAAAYTGPTSYTQESTATLAGVSSAFLADIVFTPAGATGTISATHTTSGNSYTGLIAIAPPSAAPVAAGSWIQPPGRSPAARFATRRGLTMLGRVEELLGGIGAGLTIAGSVPMSSILSIEARATAAALAPAILVTSTPSAATATAQALVPVVQSTIQPAAATATAQALTPAILVTITPSAAAATAQALAPAVPVPVTIQPSAATATAAALAPSLLVTITPPAAAATALALAPVDSATIQPAAAAATATALAPVLRVTILPAAAAATAQALVPAVIVPITIQPAAAAATAQALIPALLVTVAPSGATASAATLAPALFVKILPVAATGSGVALVPAILIGVVIQPPVAAATAAGLVPTIRVTILPAVTTSSGVALIPTLPGTIILPPIATASALALAPILAGPLTIPAPSALASATALVPVVVVPAPGFVGTPHEVSLVRAGAYYRDIKSLTHGMAVFYGQLTPPANYTTGGVSYVLPPGIAQTPPAAVVMNFHPVGGYSFEYVPATGVVKIYSAGGTEVAPGTNLQSLGYVPYVAFPIRPNNQ